MATGVILNSNFYCTSFIIFMVEAYCFLHISSLRQIRNCKREFASYVQINYFRPINPYKNARGVPHPDPVAALDSDPIYIFIIIRLLHLKVYSLLLTLKVLVSPRETLAINSWLPIYIKNMQLKIQCYNYNFIQVLALHNLSCWMGH